MPGPRARQQRLHPPQADLRAGAQANERDTQGDEARDTHQPRVHEDIGDVVGLIEVMKTFHELRADAAGTVTGFLIGNEEPVIAGQVVAELAD